MCLRVGANNAIICSRFMNSRRSTRSPWSAVRYDRESGDRNRKEGHSANWFHQGCRREFAHLAYQPAVSLSRVVPPGAWRSLSANYYRAPNQETVGAVRSVQRRRTNRFLVGARCEVMNESVFSRVTCCCTCSYVAPPLF